LERCVKARASIVRLGVARRTVAGNAQRQRPTDFNKIVDIGDEAPLPSVLSRAS
jgi:hypothetical protein